MTGQKYGITPHSASGKEKYISGTTDFGAAARRGHGFLTGPQPHPLLRCGSRHIDIWFAWKTPNL